jgi:hypothetical protein
MIGRTLRSVTLEQRGWALSSNFLKVRLAAERPSNQLAGLEIGAVVQDGLAERALFPIV